MALGHNPSIVRDGLVFYYDMSNTQKSWRGLPTTNSVPSADTMPGWNNYYRTVSSSTFITEFGTTSYRFINQPSWNGIARGISIPSTGTYTFSAWFRYLGGSIANNGATVYISGWGGSDSAVGIDKTKIGIWQRISITLNCTNTSMTFYLISYGGTDNGTGNPDYSSWEVTMPQVEPGSFATPFVNGTRSNTQAILDLTNNNTVTANSLTYNVDGTFGFNGSNNYISIPVTSTLNFSSAFTLEAWINPSSYTGDIIILGQGSYYLTMNGSYQLSVYCYGKSPEGYHTTTETLSQNNWNHICAAWSTSEVSLYINGEFKKSVSTTGTPNSVITQVWVGSEYNGTQRSFNGSIGTTRIYNRGLTATEVLQNFNAQRDRYGV